MKIRRIIYGNGDYYVTVGDFITDCHKTKKYEVTEIKLEQEGYGLLSNGIWIAWIPFHAVTMVFMEVENES